MEKKLFFVGLDLLLATFTGYGMIKYILILTTEAYYPEPIGTVWYIFVFIAAFGLVFLFFLGRAIQRIRRICDEIKINKEGK
jgi:TRAP-type C4-dicarboxylate transport system permease small subunit